MSYLDGSLRNVPELPYTKKISCVTMKLYKLTSDPPRFQASTMLTLTCFSTILGMLNTYKSSPCITPCIKKSRIEIRRVVKDLSIQRDRQRKMTLLYTML
jgi:hypothetical protein